jgi:HEAT repeat protein
MVVQVVANALNDSDLLVRSGAMRSILRLNAQGANKPVVAALLKLLQDGNAEVRTAASNALRRIDHEAAAKTGVK